MSEIITRNHLPHWYVPGAAHFVTFRLAGSLPRVFIEQMKQRREFLLNNPPAMPLSTLQHHERVHKLLFAAYDKQLDAGSEVRWLEDPRVAALVRRSLYYWHGRKYDLLAYSIMPNHVHVLLLPRELPPRSVESALHIDEIGETSDQKSPLSDIMHSLKSYTAHEANKLLRRKGPFWQHESYDHWVRDEEELERIVEYINGNAVKAGLADYAHAFFWCSAHDRFLHDGDTSGWLLAGLAGGMTAVS